MSASIGSHGFKGQVCERPPVGLRKGLLQAGKEEAVPWMCWHLSTEWYRNFGARWRHLRANTPRSKGFWKELFSFLVSLVLLAYVGIVVACGMGAGALALTIIPVLFVLLPVLISYFSGVASTHIVVFSEIGWVMLLLAACICNAKEQFQGRSVE
jgi:hypothetical protein